MIKELTELVTLLEQTLPNHEELLSLLSKNNRDVLKLFHAVQANKFRTESEAIEKTKIGERTKFRQVAKELLRCLEQMVLQIGFDKIVQDELNQGKIRGFQQMAIMKSQALFACKNSSRRTAEELLRLGRQYARPDFVIEAAKFLMDYVSVAGESLKEFETYLKLYEEYSHWRMLEEKSQIYIEKLKNPYAKKKSLQKEYAVLAQQFVEELKPFVGTIDSHHFHLCFYSIKSIGFFIEAKYDLISDVNDEAIKYFESRQYTCCGTLNIFYYLEVANCFFLGNYDRGRKYFKKAIDVANSGTINWFNTYELGFYLCMHEQDYREAAEIYIITTKHKRFLILRDAKRELWHILGAYLYIMQKLTGVDIPEGMVPKVKSSKFRNEIKDFSQDKMGMNIAILAAEVLLDFVEGKEDELWDRIAALEKYRERYLRNNEDTHRSQLFIKILMILSKYNYDRDKFLDKAAPYLAEMRKAPLQLSNQAHELEIVPYEQLIQAVANHLQKRWGSKNGKLIWPSSKEPPSSSIGFTTIEVK